MISHSVAAPPGPPAEVAPPVSIPAHIAPMPLPERAAAPSRTGLGRWLWWLMVLAVGGAGWHYWPAIAPKLAPYLPSTEAPKAKTGPRTTAVVASPVSRRDMNLYLNGLGTVTALSSVTIRARVDGELIQVAFTEGRMVKEGELLAKIDPRQYQAQRDQAAGQLARDEATLRTAKLTLARYNMLLDSKITTQQQIDEQLAIVQQTEGAIKTDQAMIANADLQLAYCTIVAPVSGRIGLRLVDQGNIVRANDANGLAVIAQLQPIALVFTVPQDDIGRVQQRMQEDQTLVVDAFSRDFTRKFATGRLIAIDNQVDPTNGTVRLKAQFDNDDGALFPNQFVNARLLVDVRRDAIVVPSAAVQRGPSGTFVYVVQPDETAEVRNVAIGPTEGAETAIESGLQAGELVVTEGLDKLQNGAKVAIRDPKSKDEGKGAPQKKPAG